jgi:hypothetical protein
MKGKSENGGIYDDFNNELFHYDIILWRIRTYSVAGLCNWRNLDDRYVDYPERAASQINEAEEARERSI